MQTFSQFALARVSGASIRAAFTSTAVLILAMTNLSLTTQNAHAQFTTPEDAQQQGISAYRGGYYDLAKEPLEFAASHGMFLAQFYLAELYADNNTVLTDHSKAYVLYQAIANNNADVDPVDRSRAPFVAQALTSLARYLTIGLPDIGVRPNAKRAAKYLHHAAIFFNHEDAQFELAKLYLKGEGVQSDVARGKHWLATLVKKGHAGAQAFLADLHWRGLFVKRDPFRALALISVAVKNAPEKDRVWIEDVYQNIYCGAPKGVRAQVDGSMVARWDRRYGRKPLFENRSALGALNTSTYRVCKDGEVPPLLNKGSNDTGAPGKNGRATVIEANGGTGAAAPQAATGKASPPASGVARGSAFGAIGSGFVRDVGADE